MSDDTFLEVDADGSNGTGAALAHVLRSVADTLDEAPEDRRYEFELTVNESQINESRGDDE